MVPETSSYLQCNVFKGIFMLSLNTWICTQGPGETLNSKWFLSNTTICFLKKKL